MEAPALIIDIYRQYIYLITWFSGQYGETLHSCAAFSLAYGSGKYLYTLVQYLTILPTKPGNEVFIMYCLLAKRKGSPTGAMT